MTAERVPAGGVVSPSVVYHCPRASSPIWSPIWAEAPRTARFVDADHGGAAFLHSDAAFAWDDEHLYVTAQFEERDVWTTGATRTGIVWQENTLEVLLASDGAIYNLSINAAGETQELLFAWNDAYQRGGRYDVAELDLATAAPMVIGGDSGPHHRRGRRWLFDDWNLSGLQTSVQVDGTLNQRLQLDRGWSVQLSLPWEGLAHVLDGVPTAGSRLRVALARHQMLDQRGSQYATVWSWHQAGSAGMYAPESYPVVELSA